MTTGRPPLAGDLEALGYAAGDGLVTADAGGDRGARGYQWRDLRDRVRLDAAFFRDGVPLVGFADLTRPAANLTSLRQRLWNYGRLPFLIAVTQDDLAVYNALDHVDADAPSRPLHRSERTAASLSRFFHREEVESGQLSAQFAPQLRAATRADATLLRNLRHLRSHLGTSDARRASVDALVGGSLLTSYLSDRRILHSEHFRELADVDHLHDALAAGSAVSSRLFRGLAERFNGDVFGALAERTAGLKDADYDAVLGLLRGDELATGQTSLWPYNFAVLPSDLVSSIYEQLLDETQRDDAAFYTPHTLVDIALDEVIPWDPTPAAPSIIDMACGSGAFITSAFRRLAFRQHTHAAPATYPALLATLRDSIFGVDWNESAVRVAAFGLYLALLEEVDPPTVWDEVVLPPLIGSNLLTSDAFAPHALRQRTFDVVLGNPPWKRGLTRHAENFRAASELPVADNQIALAFVWLAEAHLRPGGRLALVLPAKNLLHNHSPAAERFRAAMLERLDVNVVIDLSAIRRSLFVGAIAPTAMLVATKRAADEEDGASAGPGVVTYLAVHPHPDQASETALVVNPERLTSVRRPEIDRNPRMWRTLLWGSMRDVELIERLRDRYPAASAVSKAGGWTASQGFQTGRDENDASHLHGLPLVETNDLQVLRINSALSPFDVPALHRPRSRGLYRAPHAVFSRTIRNRSDICGALLDFDAVHPAGTVGVSCPQEDRLLLMLFTAATVSTFGRYWHFFTSAQWGVERDAVERNDLMSLPLPLATPQLLERLEAVVGAAEDESEINRQALDELVYEIYGIKGLDQLRLEDALETALTIFHRRFPEVRGPGTKQLETYKQTVLAALQAFMPDLVLTAQAKVGGTYITFALTVGDGDPSTSPAPGQPLRLGTASTAAARTTGLTARPNGFLVDDDTVYIVKSAHWERWTVDAALGDAERVLAALLADV